MRSGYMSVLFARYWWLENASYSVEVTFVEKVEKKVFAIKDFAKSSENYCIVTVIYILELKEVTLSQLERMERGNIDYMNRDAQQKEEESKIVKVERLYVRKRARMSWKYAGMR